MPRRRRPRLSLSRRRSPPRVSSLRARPRARIEVELEGEAWRTLPAEVVLVAGLDLGVELDRERARRLRRELRRHEAMSRAARSLAHRDLSEQELSDRLARANVAPEAAEGSRRQAGACRSSRRRPGRPRARRAAGAAGRGRPARPARPRGAGNRRRARRGCSGRPRPRAGACGTHRRGARAGAANGPLSRAKGLLRRDRSRACAKKPLQRVPLRLYDEWATPDIFCLHTRSFRTLHHPKRPEKHLDHHRDDAERGLTGTV